MQLQKERVSQLIQNGISSSPIAVHGTATESIVKMAETGHLPSGNKFEARTRGYLYMAPVQEGFRGTVFYSKLTGFSRREALRTARNYASGVAENYYYTYRLIELGIEEGNAERIMRNWVFGAQLKVLEEEADKAEKFLKQGLVSAKEAHRHKGVIIEINEEIFSEKLSLDPDGDGIRVWLPEGLPVSMVRSIKPVGEVDSLLLSSYLRK